MKKITAIALIGIALTGCKKDGQTASKETNKAGKAKAEAPANTERTEEPAPEIAEVKPAISDSAGVYTQSYKLVPGQSYPLTTYTKNVQTLTAPDGKAVSGTSEATDEMSFRVNKFENNIYDITINLMGKKNSETANGQKISIDTNSPEPKDENLKLMWAVNKALAGSQLKMMMKPDGTVLSVSGFDNIYTKVESVIKKHLKNAEQQQNFMAGFKQSLSDRSLKEQLEKNLNVLPKKGAKIGESWTHTENASPDGSVKLTTTYTLKSVDDTRAILSVSGGIPKKSDKRSKDGMTHSISSEMSQSGTVIFDRNTGWIYNQNIAVKTSQSESISDGKQSQTIKNNAVTTVIVNPGNK